MCDVTMGCVAFCDIAVHGQTTTLHMEECWTRIGEQMEHHLEGHERLQVHKRRRKAVLEVQCDRASVVREDDGDLALLMQQKY